MVFFANHTLADDYSSTGFTVSDPVILSGSYGTSASYGLLGSISGLATGTSTSASFGVNSGFLYFPVVTSPVVSATAGDGSVALTWTASTGSLGFNVSGYSIGKSTSSGGPYTSTSVGNVTSSTVSGLTNSTTYYFVIFVLDGLSNKISTSTEVSSRPVATTVTSTPTPTTTQSGNGAAGSVAAVGPASGSTGGAGGSGSLVVLQGYAYPFAKINIVKNGVTLSSVIANKDGDWSAPIETLSGASNFLVFATDANGRSSLVNNIDTDVAPGKATAVSSIISAPTISSDKIVVQTGHVIEFSGHTYPFSRVRVTVNSSTAIIGETTSDARGYWVYRMNSNLLEDGNHTVKAQAILPAGTVSPHSETIGFVVGKVKDVFRTGVAAGPATGVTEEAATGGRATTTIGGLIPTSTILWVKAATSSPVFKRMQYFFIGWLVLFIFIVFLKRRHEKDDHEC